MRNVNKEEREVDVAQSKSEQNYSQIEKQPFMIPTRLKTEV